MISLMALGASGGGGGSDSNTESRYEWRFPTLSAPGFQFTAGPAYAQDKPKRNKAENRVQFGGEPGTHWDENFTVLLKNGTVRIQRAAPARHPPCGGLFPSD